MEQRVRVRASAFTVVLSLAMLAAPAGAQKIRKAKMPSEDVLSRRLPRTALHAVTIARAFWDVTQRVGVPGGLVSIEGRPEELKVDLVIPKGTTLRQALNQIVSHGVGLKWKLADGVVDLFPPWSTSAMEMMNVRIARFDLPDVSNFYLAGQELIDQPEVRRKARALGFQPIVSCCGLTGVYYGPGQPRPHAIPVHLKNVTLLQVLNAVMRARKHVSFWLYQEGSETLHGRSIRTLTIVVNFGPPQ